MSEEQKIWFIYLTDHHEGPFTVAEVAEKAAAGLVTSSTLAWKDGMAEWIAVETIPELSGVITATPSAEHPVEASSSPLTAEESEVAGDGVSLAQMLAASQASGETEMPALSMDDGASTSSSAAPEHSSPVHEPADKDEVWTLRSGKDVSGLFSMEQLKQMAKAGDLADGAMIWHAGWEDFRPISGYPVLDQLKKNAPKKAKTSKVTQSTGIMKLKGLPAAVNHDEESTDVGIARPQTKFDELKAKLQSFFKKKEQVKVQQNMQSTFKVNSGKKKSGFLGIVTLLLAVLIVVGAAGAAYFFLFSSPVPSSMDVAESELVEMRATVKIPLKQGGKLFLAKSVGTEDAPADPSSPKFYVATNLPEGSAVQFSVKGLTGTLVNALHAEKSMTANVAKTHVAAFENFKDESGKPLPTGEYSAQISADGAEKLELKLFLGRKGGTYETRLRQYKDKLQKEYDDELGFLREEVNTLKSAQAEMSKQLLEFKTGWAKANQHAHIQNDWRNFTQTAQQILPQLEQKAKERMSAPGERFSPNIFKDISTAIAQMQQLVLAQTHRLQGGAIVPGSNPDELEGLIQATTMSLEQAIAQAVVKSPLDPPAAAPALATPPPATTATPVAPARAVPAQPLAPQPQAAPAAH